MEIFGVGPAELVLILVVVLLIFGPDQLPEVAKKLGKATRDIRHSLNDINSEVNDNLKPFQELKDLKNGNLTVTKVLDNLLVADDPPEQPAPAAGDEPAVPPVPPAAETPSEAAPAPTPPAESTGEDPSTRG